MSEKKYVSPESDILRLCVNMKRIAVLHVGYTGNTYELGWLSIAEFVGLNC